MKREENEKFIENTLIASTKCDDYSFNRSSAYKELLDSYVVKPGDNLISIVSNEINNPSLIGDVIVINSEDYPLISEGGQVRPGWKLYLPSEDIDQKNFDTFQRHSGHVLLDSKEFYDILRRNGDRLDYGRMNETMQDFIVENGINNGDCITVYEGKFITGYEYSAGVYKAEKQ